MADSTGPRSDLISIITEPLTFITMPTGFRLRIYQLLTPEIVLRIRQCRENVTNIEPLSRDNLRDYYSTTPPPAFLLVSKQTYAEVRPIVDSAPVVLEGLGSEALIPASLFPDQLLSRVYKVTIFSSKFACLSPRHGGVNISWVRDLHTPRLRSIDVQSPFQYVRYLPEIDVIEQHNLEYPVMILPCIAQWLEEERTHHHTSFKINTFLDDLSQYQLNILARTRRVIGRYQVVLKSQYHCEIRAKDPFGWKIIFTDRFSANIVWDEDGWRIEDLPDLRDKWWWEKWLKHGVEPGRKPLKIELNDETGYEAIQLEP